MCLKGENVGPCEARGVKGILAERAQDGGARGDERREVGAFRLGGRRAARVAAGAGAPEAQP